MAKSRSQLVNLPGARPLMNPLHWAFLNNNINNIKIILLKLDVGGVR